MKRSSIKLFIILGVSEEYEDLTWWHFPPLYLGCNFQSRILLTCPQMTHKMRDGAVGRWTMSQHPATFVVCNPGVLLQKSRQTFSVNDQIESILGFTSVQLCCCRVKQTYRTCSTRAVHKWMIRTLFQCASIYRTDIWLPMPACEHHPFTRMWLLLYIPLFDGPSTF